jgi:AAA ATPase domain/TIR domain
MTESPPGRIFISYRRQETAWPARQLYDVVAERFGAEQVFKDVDDIAPGDDFVERITAAVESCDVLLVLIGRQWLTIIDENGQRRLDNPEDFVRLEVETALTRNVRVIPILVDNARMPRKEELPPDLAPLARRHAVEVSPITFDTKRLMTTVHDTLAELRVVDRTGLASPKSPPEPDHPREQVAAADVERLNRPLVGRAGEIDAVVGLMRGAAHGKAGALLITGEAGVGKTALVDEACSQAAKDADVLWASCLPLTSLAVPFLPLASALRAWAADRDVPLPVLGGWAGGGPAGFDTWLDHLCRQRPVLLVVDDLQWADQSSLDVLMYVLAGLAGRRLAVMTTTRSGEEGEPLRRWLADVRRFPGVGELTLSRLDRVSTSEQVAGLLGRPPHQSLVDDVYTRSQGNAYLTTLLVRDLSPDARSLPAGLPTNLREAATRAWRALSAPTRKLTSLVAVAGRLQRANQLVEVAATTGITDNVIPLVREAVDGGVLEVGEGGTYWFVHPLLAEVLEAGLLPDERATLHAAFAAALKPTSADELSLEATVALADHHYRAGHQQQAYHWALRSADAAERAGGATETLRLLRRGLELGPNVSGGSSAESMLMRIRDVAARTGEFEQELTAVDDLLAMVDRDRQPLRVAELLIQRKRLRYMTGQVYDEVADIQEAFRLSAADPRSAEHALAMAQLAYNEIWHGVPTGPDRAEEAVQLARACRSDLALCSALLARVMAWMTTGRASSGVTFTAGFADSEEARAAAARCGDYLGFYQAAQSAGTCLDGWISSAYVRYTAERREELIRLGAPHLYVANLSTDEAPGLLMLGDWRACEDRLRVALGATPGVVADINARLTAALLACWQGRMSEAHAHLTRAEELVVNEFGFGISYFDAVRAELAVATGDTKQAVSAALAGLQLNIPPNFVERLLPLAARALANDIQAQRDRDKDHSSALSQLDDLRRRHPTVPADLVFGPVYQLQLLAMQALYDAETQRGHNDPEAATAWQRAAQLCSEAGLAWDEAYTWWRAAETLAKERTARNAHRTGARLR